MFILIFVNRSGKIYYVVLYLFFYWYFLLGSEFLKEKDYILFIFLYLEFKLLFERNRYLVEGRVAGLNFLVIV